jgi:hypothetical protein
MGRIMLHSATHKAPFTLTSTPARILARRSMPLLPPAQTLARCTFRPGLIPTPPRSLFLPVQDDGKASLECNSGAVMTYTGSGDAFTAIPTSTAPNAANVKVTGCTFVGTASAANGIHTKVFNKGTFTNVTVRGFTGATAACVLNEGTNTVDYVSPNLKSCGYAIRNVGVVYLAANYAANAINVIGGHLTGCVTRCIFEDATLSGTVGLNDGNHYIGTTIDGNNTQNVFIQGCNACTFQGGYQEEPAGSSVAQSVCGGRWNLYRLFLKREWRCLRLYRRH